MKIKTTNIHGKQYVEVPERIHHFWLQNPNWSLKSEVLNICFETGNVLMKAWVEDENGVVKAVGHAHEFQANKKATVNSTSYVENCETSAYGRALGIKGVGSREGIASAEEVNGAISMKKEMDKAPVSEPVSEPVDDRVTKMVKAFAKLGVTEEELEEWLGHPIKYVTDAEIDSLKGHYRTLMDAAEPEGAGELNQKFPKVA